MGVNAKARRSERRRRRSEKSKAKSAKTKKKKKRKKKKFNNAMWQTIVLATAISPTEDTTMLFEEGPKEKEMGKDNYMGKQQRSNGKGKGKGKGKAKRSLTVQSQSLSKGGKAEKPKSPKASMSERFSALKNPFRQSNASEKGATTKVGKFKE